MAPDGQRKAALAAAALAAACFIGMDVAAKTLTAQHHTLQVTFLRFAAGALFAVPLWCWQRTPLPARPQWRWHALRSGLLLVALLCWFYSLSKLTLVQAVGVGYTAPIFIALLAMLVLKERPSRWIWLALAIGVLGVGVGLWPAWLAERGPASAQGAQRLLGMGAAAVSAVSYAGVVVLARHQAQHDALWTILLVQNLLPLALLAGPAWWFWRPMALADLPTVLLMGALATVGLLAITWAFSHIEASLAAPMEYSGLVWAGLLGYLVFGELPTAWGLGSALLIVLGSLLLLRR